MPISPGNELWAFDTVFHGENRLSQYSMSLRVISVTLRLMACEAITVQRQGCQLLAAALDLSRLRCQHQQSPPVLVSAQQPSSSPAQPISDVDFKTLLLEGTANVITDLESFFLLPAYAPSWLNPGKSPSCSSVYTQSARKICRLRGW
jgi:hypothetical protein